MGRKTDPWAPALALAAQLRLLSEDSAAPPQRCVWSLLSHCCKEHSCLSADAHAAWLPRGVNGSPEGRGRAPGTGFCAEPAEPLPRALSHRGHSAGGAPVHVSQTRQQPVVWASWRCHHLKHRLEGPAVELLLYLVSVKVGGDQAEEVHVHLLQLAHPADDVREGC